MFRHMLRCYATDSMAPGGIEPPHAASKAAALSAELRGRAAKGYPGPRLATLCRLGGGSSVGRAPGCGPGGRGFESRPPPMLVERRALPGPVAQRTERQPSKLRAVVRLHPGPSFLRRELEVLRDRGEERRGGELRGLDLEREHVEHPASRD